MDIWEITPIFVVQTMRDSNTLKLRLMNVVYIIVENGKVKGAYSSMDKAKDILNQLFTAEVNDLIIKGENFKAFEVDTHKSIVRDGEENYEVLIAMEVVK